MAQRPTANSGEAGYTLVELLIVLTLLGVLSLLLVSGLNFGVRAWELGEGSSLAVREVATAQARLRRALTEAYPSLDTTDPTHPHVAFEGGKESANFIAPDRLTTNAGRARITIEMSDGALVLRARDELAVDGTTRDEVLLRNVAGLSFAYLGADGASWANEWREQTRLPRLIRLTVTFAHGDRRTWSPFVVAPRVAADVACSFDPLTKSCRGR